MEGGRAGNYHVEILLCSSSLSHLNLAFHVIILFNPHHNLHCWLPITCFTDENKTNKKKQKEVQYLTQSETIYKCAETF